MRMLIIGLGLSAGLSGCMTNPSVDSLTSDQRARLSKIVVLQDTPTVDYEKIGEVSGLSCHRNAYQAGNVTEAEALEGVKIRAAKLGADAVINTFCQRRSDSDVLNNCFSSVKCIGDAIRLKQ